MYYVILLLVKSILHFNVINLAYFLLIKCMLVDEIETNLKAWLGS
jgi:hypothetical protein